VPKLSAKDPRAATGTYPVPAATGSYPKVGGTGKDPRASTNIQVVPGATGAFPKISEKNGKEPPGSGTHLVSGATGIFPKIHPVPGSGGTGKDPRATANIQVVPGATNKDSRATASIQVVPGATGVFPKIGTGGTGKDPRASSATTSTVSAPPPTANLAANISATGVFPKVAGGTGLYPKVGTAGTGKDPRAAAAAAAQAPIQTQSGIPEWIKSPRTKKILLAGTGLVCLVALVTFVVNLGGERAKQEQAYEKSGKEDEILAKLSEIQGELGRLTRMMDAQKKETDKLQKEVNQNMNQVQFLQQREMGRH
jgi:hypothetical protein